jgi:hypothetical protein
MSVAAARLKHKAREFERKVKMAVRSVVRALEATQEVLKKRLEMRLKQRVSSIGCDARLSKRVVGGKARRSPIDFKVTDHGESACVNRRLMRPKFGNRRHR